MTQSIYEAIYKVSATEVATAVLSRSISAQQVVEASLERIAAVDPHLNSFTTVLSQSARAQAEALDRAIARGGNPGPLAGVPFAVKNLFDVAGIPTLAGSKINQEHPPATQDATLISALKHAGAILIGALNMDEYAYGFTTENAHYGDVHNPHHVDHMAGGSSGGSAAAVAGGLVPLSLGSDTNGSIRVPASLCGILGLKPTYGRLSRAGSVLFAASFDHVGPFARSVRDIATAFDIMQGPDPRDPVCTSRSADLCSPELDEGIEGLRIAMAADYFTHRVQPEVLAAVEAVAQALGTSRQVSIPEAARARAAAYVITASEGASQHRESLYTRPQDFDPATRDRFLAGLLIPSQWVTQAQRFRAWYQQQVRAVFETVDVLVAPTTPCPAPRLGQTTMMLDGEELLTRPNLGLFTQPLSFIGLPILSVPVQRAGQLPIGVQLIAAPYQEKRILQVAAYLERAGVIAAPVAEVAPVHSSSP